MPDTGNAKDYLELPPTNFSIFTLKNVTWRTYLISLPVLFSISFCLYRAFFTHLISSNLSCNLWYCDQLVHFEKETHANIYRHSLWEYSKRFHCSFEWHLTPPLWRYLLKPVLGGHPVLSGHYSIPRGCPLNAGFTLLSKFFCNFTARVRINCDLYRNDQTCDIACSAAGVREMLLFKVALNREVFQTSAYYFFF